jgi:hypothetical protein
VKAKGHPPYLLVMSRKGRSLTPARGAMMAGRGNTRCLIENMVIHSKRKGRVGQGGGIEATRHLAEQENQSSGAYDGIILSIPPCGREYNRRSDDKPRERKGPP